MMRVTKTGLGAAVLALVIAASLNAPAMAQPDIDFGEDSSEWANDGECDDPRFTGEGMAEELEDVDLGKDATDCRAAFEAGTITLSETTQTAPATAAPATEPEIDFGDDSSDWARDGECYDPRFTGEGMAAELEDVDLGKDATDCRAAFEAGTITLSETTETAPATAAPATEPEIGFGDDSSEWAKDGECDDPRFKGEGMAAELEDVDTARDATDCRAAFEAGTITLADETEPSAGADDIDFGDDSSEWANDQECDDPRFAGTGMASQLDDSNIARDATDCRNAFEDGTITLAGDQSEEDGNGAAHADLAAIASRIDFGDDSSDWANDGECDDPDFFGPNVSEYASDVDRMKDASDCRAAFLAGEAALGQAISVPATGAFDYGDDSSEWANDGQCDDWRFTGSGMAKKLSSEDVAADASDCRMLEEQGDISIKPVYQPDYAAGAPYDSAGIEFGDNSSDYANDNQCDDPRFEGPGVASTVFDSDIEADADDCRAAVEAGTATLR